MSPPLRILPRTRGDCASVPRPCHHESCRYHLGVGRPESCSLDVAERGTHDLKEVGELMGLTYQRVQQIEVMAMRKMAFKGSKLR